MMVLHWACIVVQQSQRVAGLDQEVIVHASVLVVVDDGGKVTREKLALDEVVTLGKGKKEKT